MNNKSKIIIDQYGTKFYHKCRKLSKTLHRVDGPAIERIDGHKEWFIDGKRHREDGPAIEGTDGRKSWWLNGEFYPKENWFQKLSPEQQENFLWNLT